MRSLIVCLLLLPAIALAEETIAFGDDVVTQGNSVAAVREAAGEPDRIAPMETVDGADERWEYLEDGKTVLIWFRGGQVLRPEEVRGCGAGWWVVLDSNQRPTD